MARSGTSVQKRRQEARKLEKAQQKAARKAARLATAEDGPDVEDGVDPDLAGIVAGPQPVREDPLAIDNPLPEF